jgi:hypothetical protein
MSMRWGMMLAVGLALMGLAGCSGSFTSSADLAEATPRVTPIEPGVYLMAAGSPEGLAFERIDNDRYLVTQQPPQQGAEPIPLSVFGPLDGFYVAQIGPQAQPIGVAASFGNFIFRVKDDGGLAVANDLAVRSSLGGALADALGVSADPPKSAAILTDNAALNWAIIARALARDGASLAISGELVPAPR